MEQKLKYRLVGAAVILALMAFFLPLILDSKKYKTEIVSQIPTMPNSQQIDDKNPQQELAIPNSDTAAGNNSNNQEAKPLIIELDKGLDEQDDGETKSQQESANSGDKGTEAELLTKADEVKEQAQTPVAKTESEDKPVEAKQPEVTPQNAEEKLAETSKEAVKDTKTSEPVKKVEEKPAVVVSKTPDFKESAYVIQIGSFSNKENASKLVDELRKQDYRAYQRVSKDFSRVFVGPYPEMSIAEARSSKLAEIVGNSVKVIEFDPIKH
ncbi:MAG: SPOR domain-containing protein [Gammaproteobacteria bacterium]|nr:SPOR domain-containing protein [Gammaproteobacteria bacterium]